MYGGRKVHVCCTGCVILTRAERRCAKPGGYRPAAVQRARKHPAGPKRIIRSEVGPEKKHLCTRLAHVSPYDVLDTAPKERETDTHTHGQTQTDT